MRRLRSSLFFALSLTACGGMAMRSSSSGGQPSPSVAYAESATGERYAARTDNALVATADAPRSTFAVDVDTASMANVRRFIEDGTLPPADAVRLEEMVNYFGYADPTPTGRDVFAVTTEVAPSPFHDGRRLARIALATRALDAALTPARNLVFLVDTSGSMMAEDKLPLLISGLRALTATLRAQDTVSIVTYAGSAGVALPPTAGDRGAIIEDALASLDAGGSTAGSEGITTAYALAEAHFQRGGINRVILATDGDFNVGPSDTASLVELVDGKRATGIALTVLGFGTGNLNDEMMEQLADHGDGNYGYIDSLAEAKKLLVEQAGGTLVTVAKDVKIQVEFDPAQVASYRLLGYENRLLSEADFRNDERDAGDVGAGHHVTALYELVPTETASADVGGFVVRVRYQEPSSGIAGELMQPASAPRATLVAASDDFRFASAVAGFGMVLRASPARGLATIASVRALAAGALADDARRGEFVGLVDAAGKLGGAD